MVVKVDGLMVLLEWLDGCCGWWGEGWAHGQYGDKGKLSLVTYSRNHNKPGYKEEHGREREGGEREKERESERDR